MKLTVLTIIIIEQGENKSMAERQKLSEELAEELMQLL